MQVVSLRAEVYVFKFYADGTLLRSFYMRGGETTLKEARKTHMYLDYCVPASSRSVGVIRSIDPPTDPTIRI